MVLVRNFDALVLVGMFNPSQLVKSRTRRCRETSREIPRRSAPLVSSLGTISRKLWHFMECGLDDILLF